MSNISQTEFTVDINNILDQLGYPQKPTVVPREGIDYVAPLSSRSVPTHTLVTTMSEPNSQTSKASIPKYFNWQNVTNLKTGQPIIRPAAVQYSTGICFLISILSQMEDRLTILSKKLSPFLSYTFVLACDTSPYNFGCAGGNPVQAAQFVADRGSTNYSCAPYDWCIFDPGCVAGLNTSTQNNELLPSCASQSHCQTCFNAVCEDTSNFVSRVLFFIDPKSIKTLPNIQSIQEDIMKNGPCGATFQTPLDFILSGVPNSKYPKATQWSQTAGIYINIPNVDMYDMGNLDGTLVSDTFKGLHSIVVVGFSSATVTNLNINNGKPTEIKFWICRNSWSSSWNEKQQGFFNIAMTNKQLNINTRLHLDEMQTTDGVSFGGGVSILPSAETIKRIADDPFYEPLQFNVSDAFSEAKASTFGQPNTKTPTSSTPKPTSKTNVLGKMIANNSNSNLPVSTTLQSNSNDVKKSQTAQQFNTTLIAVSSVLGALLIGALIAVGILASKKKKQNEFD